MRGKQQIASFESGLRGVLHKLGLNHLIPPIPTQQELTLVSYQLKRTCLWPGKMHGTLGLTQCSPLHFEDLPRQKSHVC